MFASIVDDLNLTQGLTDAWSKAVAIVPKLVSFLLVMVIGLFVARLIARAVRKVLTTAKFDQTLQRVGVAKHVAKLGTTPTKLASSIVKMFITFVTITTAFAVFGAGNPVSKFINQIVDYIPRAVVAVVILGVAAYAAGFAADAMKRLVIAGKAPLVLANIAPIAIWILGGFAAVDQLGIAPRIVQTLFTAMLAVIVGSAIVAIGGGGIQPMRAQWDKWLKKNGTFVDLTPAPTPERV
jgi:Conserved TM helix